METFESVSNFLFDGDQLNTRSNLKMATGSVQNFPMWVLMQKKKNVQNKTKYYESGKYFLAIYKYHMYKILLII